MTLGLLLKVLSQSLTVKGFLLRETSCPPQRRNDRFLTISLIQTRMQRGGHPGWLISEVCVSKNWPQTFIPTGEAHAETREGLQTAKTETLKNEFLDDYTKADNVFMNFQAILISTLIFLF